MKLSEQVLKQKVRIHYRGKSSYIFYWYVVTFFVSILTLGFYLPFAANRLLSYLTQQTDIYMYDVEEKSE